MSPLTHQLVVLQLLGVDAVGVPDASVPLGHPHTLGPGAVQVAHRVQAHVAKALWGRRQQRVSISSEGRNYTRGEKELAEMFLLKLSIHLLLISISSLQTFHGGFWGTHLDDEGLVLEAGAHPQLVHVSRLVDEVLNAVEDAAASGRDAAVDSTLADGLPGDTGVSIDVLERRGGGTTPIIFYCAIRVVC